MSKAFPTLYCLVCCLGVSLTFDGAFQDIEDISHILDLAPYILSKQLIPDSLLDILLVADRDNNDLSTKVQSTPYLVPHQIKRN